MTVGNTSTIARGGKSIYGAPLGILMLEARFPRIPGDMGNGTTWPFPVLFRVVRGASPERVVLQGAKGLLPDFIAAAKDLVDLGAGQYDRLDRTAACATRLQRGRLPELLAKVGGCVDQNPVIAVGRYGEARLGARTHACVAGPSQTTHGATAIPLRKSPTRRRAEHEGGEASHSGQARMRWNQNSAGR